MRLQAAVLQYLDDDESCESSDEAEGSNNRNEESAPNIKDTEWRDDRIHIGKRISHLRKSLNLSQGALSEILEISRNTLSYIENSGHLTFENTAKILYLVEYMLTLNDIPYISKLILKDISLLLKKQLELKNQEVRVMLFSIN